MMNGGLYRVGPFVAVAALVALLAGCGRNVFVREERAAWRGQAEAQCLRAGLVKRSSAIQMIGAVNGAGTCGMDQGLRVTALENGAVRLTSRQTLNCPMVTALDRWLAEIVQPAAESTYGAQVVEVKAGSYACRSRNNQPGARLSEHSFGNGADIFSFRFADGREVAVKTGWKGAPDEQHFLRTVFTGACQQFRTVLGPGADAFHYDHLHLDLAMHDPRGLRTVCKPVLKFDPVPYEGIVDRPASLAANTRAPLPRPVYAQQPAPSLPRTSVAQSTRLAPPAAIGAPLALSGRTPLDNEDTAPAPEDDPYAAND